MKNILEQSLKQPLNTSSPWTDSFSASRRDKKGGDDTIAITSIKAIEILDSRGNPTVRAIVSSDRHRATASVPSGASTGTHEALELRDKDKRYHGKGVQKAVKNVNTKIAKLLKGKDPSDQEQIDRAMIKLDGTETKSELGANAILAVSMAACKLGALEQQKPLYQHIQGFSNTKRLTMPIPQLNIINSGKHAGIDHDVQEHMILPVKFKDFREAIRAGAETYHELKRLLKKTHGAQATLVGDEGGFAPPIADIRERLDLIMEAIDKAGYRKKILLGIDAAASEFYVDKLYKIRDQTFDTKGIVDLYKGLAKDYPLATLEDGMHEDDWEGWQLLHKTLGKKIQLVGDDLLVTNKDRIAQAAEKKACNALLLKVNQIGSVTEAIEAAHAAQDNRWNVVVSHRSGETEDDLIADLVVGLGASQSKFGAPARSDRNAKYNRLLEIQDELRKVRYQKL